MGISFLHSFPFSNIHHSFADNPARCSSGRVLLYMYWSEVLWGAVIPCWTHSQRKCVTEKEFFYVCSLQFSRWYLFSRNRRSRIIRLWNYRYSRHLATKFYYSVWYKTRLEYISAVLIPIYEAIREVAVGNDSYPM